MRPFALALRFDYRCSVARRPRAGDWLAMQLEVASRRRRRVAGAIVGSLAAALALAAAARLAAADGGAAAGASPYAVESEGPFSLRALVDLRIARGSEAPSWQEGGPGKLRYGGIATAGDFERVTRFAIAQLALQPAVELPWGWRAQAQLNWDGDVDDRGDTSPDHDPVRLVEAFVRKDWSRDDGGTALLVGLRNPPFSLEHLGPARTPLLSLTPSALDSWLWEEGRIVGFEGQWWHSAADAPEMAAFAGAGFGPDQQGILLARRGWVLSDFLSGVNSKLPLPGTGELANVFDERDGRPALYAGASVTDPWKIATAHAGYSDNLGNLAVSGVWETRFGVAGVVVQPPVPLELVVEWLYGTTTTRGAGLASTISAVYPMISYRWRNHRVSFRYDDFSVRDDDGGPSTTESGHAFTVAYLLEIGVRHRVAVEYATVDSDRPGVRNPGDDGWQVSYRFRY
ncbi:MAG TPA: hypothetical protein VFD92_08610 [Candidatus Binatia bacterium]|nr:hypothetical protein [Candidatus Binatia bacterium]